MSIFYQGTEIDILTKAEIVTPKAKTSIVKFNFGEWYNGREAANALKIEHKLGAAPNLVNIVPCEWFDDAAIENAPSGAAAVIETIDATFKSDGTRVQCSYFRHQLSNGTTTQALVGDGFGIIAVDDETISLLSLSGTFYYTPNVDFYLICTRYEA